MTINLGRMPKKWLKQTEERYPLYLTLHEHRKIYRPHESKLILGEIMRGRCYAWRVGGITHLALQAFKDTKFSVQAKKEFSMERAHLFSRSETARLLIAREEPVTAYELAEIQWERDFTILCLRKENHGISQGDKFIPFNHENWNIFGSKQGIRYGKAEKEFLRNLSV